MTKRARVILVVALPGDASRDGSLRIGSEAEFTPRNVQTPEERTQLVYPVKVRVTGDPGFDLKPGIPADVQLDVSPEGP